MKKLVFFIAGFLFASMVAAQVNPHQVHLKKDRKDQFKAPIIRIGVFDDYSRVKPVSEKIVPDTQAIYLATIKVDSAFLVTELGPTTSSTLVVDTIQKIDGKIFHVRDIDQQIDYAVEGSGETIEYYLADPEFNSQITVEDLSALPDSQVLFVLTKKVDSLIVMDEYTMEEQAIEFDSVVIDTFYKVGETIMQIDTASDLSKQAWQSIRNEIIQDSISSDSNFQKLSDKEYLEVEENQLDSLKLVVQNDLLVNAVGIDSGTVSQSIELRRDTIVTIVDTIKIENVLLEERVVKVDTISALDRPVNNLDSKLTLTENRLSEMERKLDSLLSYQSYQNKIDPTKTVSPVAPNNDAQEIRLLQQKIEDLENTANQENDLKIAQLKQELSDFKQQRKEQLEADNDKALKREIADLRRQIDNQQSSSTVPMVSTVPVENSPAINQLKTEVSSLSQNVELMKQLLLQQQIVSAQKNQPIIVEPAVDTTSSKELIAVKKELEELKASINSLNVTQPEVENTKPIIDANKDLIDSLKQQLEAFQNELKNLQAIKEAEPIVETKVETVVVEKPIEPSVSVMSKIKGREKQIAFFKIGSYQLTPESINKAALIAQLLLEYDALSVDLEAYTDASGDATRNLLLSKRRAEAVKAAIMQYGIAERRIRLGFHGEDNQSDPAYGRRVEMILHELN